MKKEKSKGNYSIVFSDGSQISLRNVVMKTAKPKLNYVLGTLGVADIVTDNPIIDPVGYLELRLPNTEDDPYWYF